MDFKVIKHQPDLITLRIFVIKYLQEFNIILAVMGFTDQWDCFPGLQIDSRKE